MASSSVFLNLKDSAQTSIVAYMKQKRANSQYYYNIRSALEVIDREYYREYAWTLEQARARAANRSGDITKFQDIIIPIVMPQVETFVTYQTSVFLTGNPLFGVVSDAKYEDAALAMEARINQEAIRFGWKSELIKFFRDCGKYALGACEVSWDKITTPKFEMDDKGNTKINNIIWEGNRVKRWDMYNTFWDTNVHPHKLASEGEFAGTNELLTRINLKQRIANLGDDVIVANVTKAFESPTPMNEYYIPQINPAALSSLVTLATGQDDWFSWVGVDPNNRSAIAYRHTYILTTIYIRLLPSDAGIKAPQPNTPQVWKFLIVNFSIIIYAERLTNAHNLIPVLMAVPNDDGIKYQTKSPASNVQPLQNTATAVSAAMVAALRRSIGDRAIYNPLYINKKDVNSANPQAKIPTTPAAYAGVPLSEIYHQIPFSNDQFPVYSQTVSQCMGYADIVTGQNKAQQGQFVKGNKTLHEYDNVMQNANGRSQLTAIAFEDDFFTPLKWIISTNILQYNVSPEELYHPAEERNVTVDPLILRNAVLHFNISDGLLPTDKIINADAWQTAMQVVGSTPAIGSAYKFADMFSYLMKTQGANIKQFEKSPEAQQYEQALQAWQQTVLQLAKVNKDITPDKYPPQPLPEQFGLDKQGNPVADDSKAASSTPQQSPSIMQMVLSLQAPEEQGETLPDNEASEGM